LLKAQCNDLELEPLHDPTTFWRIAPSKEEASRNVRKKSSTIGFGFDEVTVPRSVLSPPSDLKRTVQIVLNFNNIH
jgi:hypothetical protein